MKLHVVTLGNSTVREGSFDGAVWVRKQKTSVQEWMGPSEKTGILVSVNPKLQKRFAVELNGYQDVGQLHTAPLKIHYEPGLGQDRWVAALGAARLHPRRNIAIVDCGTATTLNFISDQGDFRGSYILPGLGLELRSLAQGTAQLPLVQVKNFKELFAKNTLEAIGGGIYQMRLRALKSWIQDLRLSFPDLLVVGAGGEARVFEQEELFDVISEDLVLWGALEAFERDGKK